jgi:hypothetical protein
VLLPHDVESFGEMGRRAEVFKPGVLGENLRQSFEHDRLRFTSKYPESIHVISLRNIESSGGGTQDRY